MFDPKITPIAEAKVISSAPKNEITIIEIKEERNLLP